MTQLLISVKNVAESRIAKYAGIDMVDLKDPTVGALGALDPKIVSQIVKDIDHKTLVSATVGEGHESISLLVKDIDLYASLGVDVIKISVSELFLQTHFSTEMLKLTTQGVKLVAVFFADRPFDFSLLLALHKSGFFGAMLDTQEKRFSLLEAQSAGMLSRFVNLCDKLGLISGLAGSIKMSHMNTLLTLNPTFIGLRGGVCEQYNRTSELSDSKVNAVKDMLLKYNKNKLGIVDTQGLSLLI